MEDGMPPLVKNLLVALGILAVAVIGILTSFSIVEWSAAQTTLVTAEAGAIIGLLSALLAHFWPATSKEPVALAATCTAAVSATLALAGRRLRLVAPHGRANQRPREPGERGLRHWRPSSRGAS
jgi:hypothetical protein